MNASQSCSNWFKVSNPAWISINAIIPIITLNCASLKDNFILTVNMHRNVDESKIPYPPTPTPQQQTRRVYGTPPPLPTKSKYGKIYRSQILTLLHHPPGALDIREVWAIFRWTYSPSLVTVLPASRTDLWTSKQRDRQKIWLQDAPPPPADNSGRLQKKSV